jgi:NCS1 family nucleobase:cation symporter-1
MGRYESFLLLIGSVFAPLFGVLLADHFIVRPRSASAARPAALNLSGLAAWAIGIAAYQALSRLAPEFGATLPSFLVAALAFVALRLPAMREARA